MALSRNVRLDFWTDSKVIDDFTPEDRYFYLYLMTNPHTNLCGCYEISLKQMADELGYSRETVEKLLVRMADSHKVIMYSKETKEILLLNWHKYNWTSSDKFLSAVQREIAKIKAGQFVDYLEGILYGDTVSIPYEYPMDTSYNTNTNTDANTRKDNKIPPTVEEVKEYCKERNNEIDAEQFVDFYEAKGWKVGNNKMKDWKAAVRTWERREKKPKQETKFNNFAQRTYDYSALERRLMQ